MQLPPNQQPASEMRLAIDTHGSGDRTLVLLHGLGANGTVWEPLLKLLLQTWPGRIVIPDLPGHGRSPRAADYRLAAIASDVADGIRTEKQIYVAGHSMGGVLALLLAGETFALPVVGTLAFSIKTTFTPEELEKARAFAVTPARRFTSHSDAIERYLRASGLNGLIDPRSAMAQSEVVERNGAWELATDPATVLVAGEDVRPLFALARGQLIIATGEVDQIAPAEALRSFAPDLRIIAGAGHNVHVQQPAAIEMLIHEISSKD